MVTETTKRKGAIYAEYRGPGPLACNLPTTVGTKGHTSTKPRAPAFSIGMPARDSASDIPGPRYYYNPGLTNKGMPYAPSFSLLGRHGTKGTNFENTPGPGTYSSHLTRGGVLSGESNIPSISMAQRTQWSFKPEAPPPNSYSLKSTLGEKPSWSLYPRQEVGTARYAGIKAGNPAPNSYNPIEPNTFKRQSGVYTMQGRTKQKNYNSSSENPGPGAYEPKVAQKGSRGFSIGVKHSDYVTPLIIDVD